MCEKDSDSDHSCTRNHAGSAGAMEAPGAIKIFSRSIEKHELRYLEYLGDGDTSAYKKVVESKLYEEDTIIEKRECIGHGQKRVGGRLRKLKEKYHGVKLPDGKTIGGHGRLSDEMINNLQIYYGLAVRGNLEDIYSMQKNMTGLYHISSSADAPNHSMCPDEGWCKYNKDPENYQHHEGIPMCIIDLIEPIFIDLSDSLLLSRCAHIKTQNSNESFNKLIWDSYSKEVWVGKPVVEQSVSMAVGQFNDGATTSVKVLKKMGIEPGYFMSKLTMDKDCKRITCAKRKSYHIAIQRRKVLRVLKKGFIDRNKEGTSNSAAEFCVVIQANMGSITQIINLQVNALLLSISCLFILHCSFFA